MSVRAELAARPPRLETARLVLEPLEERHAALAFEAVRDERVYRFVPIDPYGSVDDLRKRYAHMYAGPKSAGERWWNWSLLLEGEPQHAIGTVETTLSDNARAFLAYGIGPAYWGFGYAYEACAVVLGHLSVATNVTLIEASVDTRNVRSISLLQRLGFTNVATHIAADHFKGTSSDEYRFQLALA